LQRDRRCGLIIEPSAEVVSLKTGLEDSKARRLTEKMLNPSY
jgi:hypothetical protein